MDNSAAAAFFETKFEYMKKKRPSNIIDKGEIFTNAQAYPAESVLSDMSELVLKVQRGLIVPALIFARHKIGNTITFFGASRIKSPAKAKEELEEVMKNKRRKDYRARLSAAKHAVEMSQYYQQSEDLAFKLQMWINDSGIPETDKPYIMTGGGPGIMEAAAKGAYMAGGVPVGATIPISSEEQRNIYVDRGVWYQFNYFFMRKFWLMAMARAVIVCPGGFGTLDEFFEILTLVKTGKEDRIPLVLFDRKFWDPIINFDELIKNDVITKEDMQLIHFSDTIDDAFEFVTESLIKRYKLKRPRKSAKKK